MRSIRRRRSTYDRSHGGRDVGGGRRGQWWMHCRRIRRVVADVVMEDVVEDEGGKINIVTV